MSQVKDEKIEADDIEQSAEDFIELMGPIKEKNTQILVFLLRSVSRRIVILERRFANYEDNSNKYREKRETDEKDTMQKFNLLLRARFGTVYWLIDKALPGVIVAVILAILKHFGII